MDDLDKLMQSLSGDEQRAVAKRSEELVTAHNLRELRALAGLTREDVSARTGFKQPSISRLEQRADMKLSTLRDYVEPLGGYLESRCRCRRQESRSLQHRRAITTWFEALNDVAGR